MKNIKNGKKLRVVCPDDVCLLEEQEVPLPQIGMAGRPSTWLDIFCPQSRCEFTSPLQLP
jgi:hypothetical protein